MAKRTLSVPLIGLFWASKRRPWFVTVGGTACFALAGPERAHTNSAATIAITCQMLRIFIVASKETHGTRAAHYKAIGAGPRPSTRKQPRPAGATDGRGFPGLLKGGYTRSSPVSTVTACPPSPTRSPLTATFTTPPRADAW